MKVVVGDGLVWVFGLVWFDIASDIRLHEKRETCICKVFFTYQFGTSESSITLESGVYYISESS